MSAPVKVDGWSFRDGDRVKVAPRAKAGTILRWSRTRGAFRVEMDEGREVWVQPEFLRAVKEAA